MVAAALILPTVLFTSPVARGIVIDAVTVFVDIVITGTILVAIGTCA